MAVVGYAAWSVGEFDFYGREILLAGSLAGPCFGRCR
jgi:hypothetical protein